VIEVTFAENEEYYFSVEIFQHKEVTFWTEGLPTNVISKELELLARELSPSR
jgi:hypothetical protein